MKRIAIIFLLGLTFYTVNVKAMKCAVLISAGVTEVDDVVCHSEYWYDLYLAYEYLYFVEGIDHDHILVCYGEDGSCFNSIYDRYKLSYHGWPDIVDYNNDTASIKDAFRRVHGGATENDTVFIRWVVGHGKEDGCAFNCYYAAIQSDRYPNNHIWVPKADLFRFINQADENDYNQRYIAWMTCCSGCIIRGDQRFDTDEKTVAITSCDWYKSSYSRGPDDDYEPKLSWDNWHAEFNYWFTGFSAGHAPGSSGENEELDADMNEDGNVSVMELYSCVWDSVEWSESYIGGPDLTLQNFYCDRYYMEFQAPNYIIAAGKFSGGNEDDTYFTIKGDAHYWPYEITMACTTGFIQLKPGFHAEEGSKFQAKIDPDLYSTSSTDLVRFGKLDPLDKSNPDKTSEDNTSEENESKVPIPTVFSCAQNKPNPFATSTTIKYGLPKDVDVQLDIYDLIGRKVRTLINAKQKAGYKQVSWDGRTSDGRAAPKGIYFYTFKAGDYVKHHKMILVK